MTSRIIKQDIYSVGVIDWDRKLFDEIIPLPEGTSYNSYLIQGSEKTALIDTADPSKKSEFLSNIKKTGLKIDYIISHHAEQDHSGLIPEVLDLYPKAKIITNSKCKELLIELLLINEEKFQTVDDRETLSLGSKTLQFFYTPWVHWPETMVSYLQEDHILFSCDFFGSHLATSDLYAKRETSVYRAAKRYYAEIMMPFRKIIQKNIQKLENLDIEVIAPSHGPLYKDSQFIMDAYREWISDETKNEVIVVYVSMHGSTRELVNHLVDKLIDKGITVKPFNLTSSDTGDLAHALVDASTLIIATPTVLTGPHPSAVHATYLVNALRPKIKFVSIIGSFGWGGRTVNILEGLLTNLKAEIIEPVLIKGYPTEDDYGKLDDLVHKILKKHNELNLAK